MTLNENFNGFECIIKINNNCYEYDSDKKCI